MSGGLYCKLYKLSLRESDRKEAIDIFERIIKQFPKSSYKHKAIKTISVLSPPLLPAKKKSPPAVKRVKKDKPHETNKVVTVAGLRYWSNPSYTRVVIDADSETTYNHRLLRKDPSIHKPKRLYVDLDNSRLGDGTMARTPKLIEFAEKHNLKIITIADLIEYRRKKEKLVRCRVVVDMPSRFGNFKLHLYESLLDPTDNPIALVKGDIESDEPVLVRV
ncbi:MAG: 3,4-dihydroxy-2-butanone-4-phosphate synthase, partial [Proteobacteria bacterium]|nr:3,4-dihydroxy-2-butanone-4-phosphate synthase [Pseudomonadota bacterium]